MGHRLWSHRSPWSSSWRRVDAVTPHGDIDSQVIEDASSSARGLARFLAKRSRLGKRSVMRARPRWLVLGLLAVGCVEPQQPRAVRERPRPDKASLFGDPGLVPTREGERARAELASAGEIEAALDLLDEVERVRVDVEHRGGGPPAVLVAMRAADDDVDADELERAATRAVEVILGEGDIEVLVSRPKTSPVPSAQRPLSLIAAVFMGLGLSLGITLERIRKIRRPSRRLRPRRVG